MVYGTEDSICIEMTVGVKTVRVTLEFPTQVNNSAEREFIGRLREMYLRRIDSSGLPANGKVSENG